MPSLWPSLAFFNPSHSYWYCLVLSHSNWSSAPSLMLFKSNYLLPICQLHHYCLHFLHLDQWHYYLIHRYVTVYFLMVIFELANVEIMPSLLFAPESVVLQAAALLAELRRLLLRRVLHIWSPIHPLYSPEHSRPGLLDQIAWHVLSIDQDFFCIGVLLLQRAFLCLPGLDDTDNSRLAQCWHLQTWQSLLL